MIVDSSKFKLFNIIEYILRKTSVPLFLFGIFFTYHLFKIPLQIAGVDIGYFLSISRDLYLDGLIPLAELRSIYTPVGYYFFGIPYLFFSEVSITHFYYFNLLLIIVSSLLFLQVLKNFNLDYKHWILLVFFLTISPLIYDIKLELIVILFLILSYFFISKYLLNRKLSLLFLSGLMIGLAVLTKQYALLLWPMSLVFLIPYSFDKSRFTLNTYLYESLYLSSGVILVILLFFGYYIVALKVDSYYLFDQFLGKVYYDCLGLYGKRELKNLIIGVKYYSKFSPFIFLIPTLLMFNKTKSYLIKHLSLLLLFFASLIPYYFQVYPHYYYFGFIPVFLLGISIFQESKYHQLIWPFFLFPIMINFYSIYVLKRDYSTIKLKVEVENEFYNQISNYIPSGSLGYAEGKKQAYFECGLKSVHSKNIGYDYVPPLCIDYLLKDTTTTIYQFYYVGTSKNLSFSEYSKVYLGETSAMEGFTPHYIYLFKKNQ